ncbi:hypothetical protein EDD85DRAFT_851202 [Armillaria nabsnona]|nr:hypothetical protein EDD85DRAFT_851202 [Armillaria nabsnona]
MHPSPHSTHKTRIQHCFCICLVFLILMFIGMFILIANLINPTGEFSYIGNTGETDNRTVRLHGTLTSADIVQATMTVVWNVVSDSCDANCTNVDIFFDTNMLRSNTGGLMSNNRPSVPTFLWNRTADLYDYPYANTATFPTDLNIYPQEDDTDDYTVHASLVYYPFDQYRANIFAFAQDASNNDSVSLIIESTSGLVVDLDIKTEFINNEHSFQEYIHEPLIYLSVTLLRSTTLKAYCIIVVVTFWFITLMICLIVITTTVCGFRQRNEIFVAPIATVFAFTELRSSMPGAPEGFGSTLDFFGILPCLALLCIASAMIVGSYLFVDPDDTSRDKLTWDNFVDALKLNSFPRKCGILRIKSAGRNFWIFVTGSGRELLARARKLLHKSRFWSRGSSPLY